MGDCGKFSVYLSEETSSRSLAITWPVVRRTAGQVLIMSARTKWKNHRGNENQQAVRQSLQPDWLSILSLIASRFFCAAQILLPVSVTHDCSLAAPKTLLSALKLPPAYWLHAQDGKEILRNGLPPCCESVPSHRKPGGTAVYSAKPCRL